MFRKFCSLIPQKMSSSIFLLLNDCLSYHASVKVCKNISRPVLNILDFLDCCSKKHNKKVYWFLFLLGFSHTHFHVVSDINDWGRHRQNSLGNFDDSCAPHSSFILGCMCPSARPRCFSQEAFKYTESVFGCGELVCESNTPSWCLSNKRTEQSSKADLAQVIYSQEMSSDTFDEGKQTSHMPNSFSLEKPTAYQEPRKGLKVESHVCWCLWEWKGYTPVSNLLECSIAFEHLLSLFWQGASCLAWSESHWMHFSEDLHLATCALEDYTM